MGRRIIYRIEKGGGNTFTEDQWLGVERLQHWYNSEFSWSTGRISFKRYVIFPNTEVFADLGVPVWDLIARRRHDLRERGLPEPEIIATMERERLVLVKWGGYHDECLASGFTRVADNEWNAYLVCDFLLKMSTLIPESKIRVDDEGRFIKCGALTMQDASLILDAVLEDQMLMSDERADSSRIFSVVDPEKYARHPAFRNVIPEFALLKAMEKREIARDWNWLGYDSRYDRDGDDIRGLDLNSKVRSVRIEKKSG